MRTALAALALVLSLAPATLNAASKPKPKRIYIFGFAASFRDSLAYVTDIQALDTAYITSKGFLADRTLYSTQLELYLAGTLHTENMTCAVFFDTSHKSLEKKFLKVRKKYRTKHAVVLTPLHTSDFRFEPEEWVELVEMELSPSETAAPAEGSPQSPPAGAPPGGEGQGSPPPGGSVPHP